VAPVFERTGRYVCSACGEAREPRENTLVTSEAELLQAFEPSRGAALPASIFTVAGLLLAALAWLVSSAALARAPAFLVGVAVVALAFAGRRWAELRRRRAWARRRYEIEQRIIGLAYRNDGWLTASAVSTMLRIARSEAQELLGELVVTGRARAEPGLDGGETTYFFGEAKRTRGLRGRVPAS
jgi:hypothetical protein